MSQNGDSQSDTVVQGQDARELVEGKIRKSSCERRLTPKMQELKEQELFRR